MITTNINRETEINDGKNKMVHPLIRDGILFRS